MSPAIVTIQTGEIHDLADFMGALRALDQRIAEADKGIGELKAQLKITRQHREGLISELRATARGDRALPFGEPEPATPPASDPKKGSA